MKRREDDGIILVTEEELNSLGRISWLKFVILPGAAGLLIGFVPLALVLLLS